MFTLTLDFLRRHLDPRVGRYIQFLLKDGPHTARVSRLVLTYKDGQPGPRTVILKEVLPQWEGDPHGPDRERRFYAELYPRLSIPKMEVYFSGTDPQTGTRLVLLEDLSGRYYFPSPMYTWTPTQLEQLLHAYAALHVSGRAALPPSGERDWLLTYHRPLPEPPALAQMAADLAELGRWPVLPGLPAWLERVLPLACAPAGESVTLVHQDVYPPNAALPLDPAEPVILLDWEMAGWGWAELDLAYLLLQPFRSSAALPRAEILDCYWRSRQALEGRPPSPEERRQRQLQADLLLSLALIPVARRAAVRPYPAGSAPWAYWESMFMVLLESLQRLQRETVDE